MHNFGQDGEDRPVTRACQRCSTLYKPETQQSRTCHRSIVASSKILDQTILSLDVCGTSDYPAIAIGFEVACNNPGDMYTEAVRIGARPSRMGLTNDAGRMLNCEECDAQYQLYYDVDAEALCSMWTALAREIITARHPHHTACVILELSDRFETENVLLASGFLQNITRLKW